MTARTARQGHAAGQETAGACFQPKAPARGMAVFKCLLLGRGGENYQTTSRLSLLGEGKSKTWLSPITPI